MSGGLFDEYRWGKDPLMDKKQREHIAVLRSWARKEISNEQAQEMHKEISERYAPLLKRREETEKAFERTDPYEDIGYRRSSKDNDIPSAAKSAMKHRSACGVKLSDKDLSRFWSKIDVKGANECWPWKNSLRGSLGYGQFRIGDRICDAHRVALELGKGPLKKGRYVCHSCDSPKCCNPRHLFAGTQKNNMDDMTEKGRGDN